MKDLFYTFLLSLACRHFIKQGSTEHILGFPKFYGTILNSLQKEFSEDSRPALKAYMKECIDDVDTSYPS